MAAAEMTLLTEDDLYLFNEGSHYRLYDKLGAHLQGGPGGPGVRFSVWAPGAQTVEVVGSFDGWGPGTPLSPRGSSGIWEGFVPVAGRGALYKSRITPRGGGRQREKSDPFAFHTEIPPRTASVVWPLYYTWGDRDWMAGGAERNAAGAPWSVYELHVGSWMRVPEEEGRSLSYRELAPRLADYVSGMGFTHVELMPVMAHPFFGSWGYQVTGYFAPDPRYGTPQDFMYLVDHLHQRGIGVILDWVPSHFPNDEHGLANFDGTHLYDHADPRRGIPPDWNSCIFNYGRHEVRSFLLSAGLFWLDRYHVDGLRIDAVASMLYLDYSRKPGEWIPNEYGGRENLEAIDFLRRLNLEVYRNHPDVQTIAEESTAWPMVSRPTYVGGLGFGMKWDMGWMHDTLSYFARDPIHRQYHHHDLTFRMLYAFSENYMLPLSHDEVVHGKGSLIGKMPGDEWRKFANLRLLLAYMHAQPGKKLLFMGGEIAQWDEWHHDGSIEWHLLQHPSHAGVQRLVRDLNLLHRREPALHELDFEPAGFAWIDAGDTANSVLSFLRMGRSASNPIAAVFNFTPVSRIGYRVGVPEGGFWTEILNTDAEPYGGTGHGNMGGVQASDTSWHGRPHSLELTLPPLGAVFLRGPESD